VTTLAPPRLPERFAIEQEIGRGGMAVVYRAHDRHLDRYVAIKVLSPDLSHAVGIERFQREITVMAKLVHPGIVALFDSGQADGLLYYVMPFVAGENLRTRLLREQRMSAEDAAATGADVAEALAYAHGAGIVHRDVKPENIFTVSGRAVLADFGIAHLTGDQPDTPQTLTTAGMVLGTVSYMSPEQASGEARIDGRSDLYSLGCVLYEMVTGGAPFTAPTPAAVLAKHLIETPRRPSELNPGLAPGLETIIMDLLAKEPGQRPATAGDAARALRSFRHATHATAVVRPSTEADRLVADALAEIYRSVGAGANVRMHLDQAGAYLTRALALEPRHARGLTALANWHFTMGRHRFLPPEEALPRGRALILDALAADDRVGEVHNSLAKIALFHDDDCYAAARHIERAVALDPDDPEGLRFQSIVCKVMGRVDDAVRIARNATRRAPELASTWNALGDALMAAGRNAEAIDPLRRAVAIQPAYGPALERLELVHARLGEFDRAVEFRMTRLRRQNRHDRAEALAADQALGPAEALRRDLERELEELLREAREQDAFADPYLTRNTASQIVVVCAALGKWHQAMDWVEQQFERRPIKLRRMLMDLPFDHRGLAVDPRYARVLRAAVLDDLLSGA
jgi:tetratricopeptide (TPR) repeat protein/tRNA A-37 threonylcarbamoyl transferase component Bud32